MSERVFVTGATGLIGRAVCAALVARGDDVVAFTRSGPRARRRLVAGVEVVEGDPSCSGAWQRAVDGCTAVINLAGEPIAAQRWNAQVRQRLLDSRVDCTRFVVEAIEAASARPRVLVSASGVDAYARAVDLPGESEDEADVFDERSPLGDGFLARLCRDWEAEAAHAAPLGVRVAHARLGVVLAAGGGALARMARPFSLFLGGRIASGKQFVSWVHLDDATSALLWLIDTDMAGPVNVVAGSVRQRTLATALGRAMHRPSWLAAPAPVVRAIVGPFAEVLLGGRQVVPAARRTAGFSFRYPTIDAALAAIYR